MTPPRPCLDCGTLTTRRRCPSCESALQRRRNALPHRQAYRDPAYRAIPRIGPCVDCGATTDLTRDHVVRLIDGGTNDPANIVIRCRSCNSARNGSR